MLRAAGVPESWAPRLATTAKDPSPSHSAASGPSSGASSRGAPGWRRVSVPPPRRALASMVAAASTAGRRDRPPPAAPPPPPGRRPTAAAPPGWTSSGPSGAAQPAGSSGTSAAPLAPLSSRVEVRHPQRGAEQGGAGGGDIHLAQPQPQPAQRQPAALQRRVQGRPLGRRVRARRAARRPAAGSGRSRPGAGGRARRVSGHLRQQAVEVQPVQGDAEADRQPRVPARTTPAPESRAPSMVAARSEMAAWLSSSTSRKRPSAARSRAGSVPASGRPSAASVSRRVWPAKRTASSSRGPAVAPASSSSISPGSRAETSERVSRSPSRKRAPRSRRSGTPARPVASAERSMLTGTGSGRAVGAPLAQRGDPGIEVQPPGDQRHVQPRAGRQPQGRGAPGGLAAEVERQFVGGDEVGGGGQPAGGAEGAGRGRQQRGEVGAGGLQPALEAAAGRQHAAGRDAWCRPARGKGRAAPRRRSRRGRAGWRSGWHSRPRRALPSATRASAAPAGLQPGVQRLEPQPADREPAILQPGFERGEPGRRPEAGQRRRRPGQRDLAADQGDLARLEPAGQQRAEVEPQPHGPGGDGDSVARRRRSATAAASTRGCGSRVRVMRPSKVTGRPSRVLAISASRAR